MKNCTGVNPKAYSTDPEGRRLCPTPFLHYPDFCPHFKDRTKEGDCYKHCEELPSAERPCYQAAFKLDAEEPVAPVPKVEAQVAARESPAPITKDTEKTATDKPFIPEGFYWCSKCKRPHGPNSEIGKKHVGLKTEPPATPAPPAETYREEIRATVEQGGLEVLEKHIGAMEIELGSMRQTIKIMKNQK